MFRRSKAEPEQVRTEPIKAGGKGRPTPTRREAEEAARARAKGAPTKGSRGPRKKLTGAQVREGMRTGDDRLLLARDQGPVRRFIRDYVDTRFSLTELMLPILTVTLALAYSGNPTLMRAANGIMFGTLLVVVYDVVMLRRRIRRELGTRFPSEPLKGQAHYAIVRLLQMRFLRRPKPQVKIGQTLPETYR
ncbi:MAG: DUF3043 domain-containing protein [Nocardioides sp.]